MVYWMEQRAQQLHIPAYGLSCHVGPKERFSDEQP